MTAPKIIARDILPPSSSVKVALVNLQTNIVENVIIVDSIDDTPPQGYYYAPMETSEIPVDPEVEQLQNIIKEVDPLYEGVKPIVFEKPITLNKTRWTQQKGFHED